MKKFTLLMFASLLSICGYSQLSLETFESVWTGTPAAPPGWTVVNEAGVNITWARSNPAQVPSYGGTYAAYLHRENVGANTPIPKDWLITPYFNMPANAQLRFYSRLTVPLDQGGIYKVKISTDADPANLAAYTDLQTWTELQINPVQTDYIEKVLTLPAITGNVHIAFVMEGDDMDRWLIDNVKVVSQCVDPSGLTVGNATLTTAEFNWTNTGNAPSWEIEVTTDDLPFTGVGTPYTGPPSIVWDDLQPDTTYKVYLRGICADEGTSSWIGPVFFNTAAVGESCSYPLVTTPPPYTTTNNTANFADNYEGTPGTSGTCGGVTGSYLSGNDVVYEFTPVTSGNVNISLTNTGTGAGMFIYDDCASIGTACIAGGTGNATVPSLAVTAGNSIYIVISSTTTAATTPYTLSIQQVFCAAPTGLAAANPTANSIDLSWAAGTAAAWQVAVQPSGTGLPTGAGLSVTSNTITASQTVTGAALTPATSYEYYVRANCGDGTFSIWSGPFIFTTTQEPAIINYTQDWETAPHNWTLNNGAQINKWVVGSAVNNGGTQSLYISNNNGVNNTYTITAASVVHAYRDVIIPAGVTSLNLAFDWKSIGESADYIRAYLVPVTFIPTPGNLITGSATNVKIGGDLFSSPNWSTFNGVINVTGMTGTRRLVLEWRNTASLGSQPPAAIDNINLSIITCPAPSAPTVVAGTLTNSAVNVSWTAPTSTPPGYDYYVSNTPTAPVAATTPTGTSATTTATGVVLQPSLTHYFWVRANCGPGDTSTWAGPLTIIAPQIPADLEFNQNFDLGGNSFSFNNGSLANKWVVGSATSNSTPNSLYISQDNGVTNSYNTTSASVVHAYRDIQMPAALDQLILTYDWKNIGENNIDYFRVWLVPVTFNPAGNAQITAAADRIQLGGNFTGAANTWATQTNVIQASSFGNSVRRLVFEWRNDGIGGNQPPAAIDNINLKVAPCPQPSALAITALSSAAATFTWTAPASGDPASGYEYYLSPDPTAPTAATAATDDTTTATLTLNNLPPSTNYNIWVRSNCGTSKSLWIGPVNFTTPQVPAMMNYVQNFDSAGPYVWDFVNGTQANTWAIGSAVSNSSPNSLYITNDSGVSNAYTVTTASVVHAYRDIQLPAAVDQVLLSFDWRNQGQANTDYFRVWMVPVDYTIVAGQQITAGAGRVQIGGNFGLNGAWSTSNNLMSVLAYQGQTRRLVFEWRNDAANGTQSPAAIDNINFSVVTCPAPTNLLMPSNNAAGTTFTWTPPSSVTPTFDFYYSASSTPPGATTTPSGTVPTPTVTLSGLADSTNYYFWVRDNCGPGDTSLWTGPFEFSTPQVASPLDYTQNFDGNTYGWTIANGNQPNRWMVGTDTSSSPGKSLYISNNGATNTYTNNLASVVHAYKDFIIPAGATALELSFDWRNLGETGWDYIRVYRVPTDYVPTTGTLMTVAADREKIGGDLVGNANWTTATYTLNSTAYANTNVRLVFEWRDDTSGGNNPPAAIDNVNFSVITCPKPIALGVTSPTQTGATFNWTEAATAASWEVYVVETGQPAPTAASEGVAADTTTYVYTTPALQPSTNYVYYVRAVCGPNDKSKWSGPVAFKTAIGNDECTGSYTVEVNPVDQDCLSFATVSYVGSTPSPQPYNCGGINGADIWYEFVATSERADIILSDFNVFATAQPVVIELYQGDVCGSLLQVDCATTNYLMAKNLIPGATYKVRLYINAATPNLTTEFKLCINTPPPPATVGQNECTVTTINYSFERPIVTGLYPNNSIDHDAVQGWRTTATDEKMEFWPFPNYENWPSYDGTQFVELNANLVSGLYQDYSTPVSTTFTYTFGHMGRQGTDTCELRAGPPGGPYVTVTTATTEQGIWHTYTGSYTTPPGQTVTRFIFQSVAAAGGDNSVGNFLDGIEFTADNGVLSVSPTELTCIDNVTTVEASGSGEWSAFPDNPAETVITNPEDNNTTITGFTANGTYRYNWTTQYCSSTIEVTYDNGSVPEPVVVAPVEYCVGETAAPLSATALADHTLNWYTVATGGTASATAPVPDTTISNVTVYYVAQQSALNCESPRVPIEVTVNAIPAAPAATTAVEYCQDFAATPLTATALAGNTLNWYIVATGGTADTTAPTPDTSATSVGTTSYYVSQVSPSGCESDRTEIVVTVNASFEPITDFTIVGSVCIEDIDPIVVPDANQTAGGFYSAEAGLVINPATGEVNLSASTPGTYNVTYTINAEPALCNVGGSTSREIIITPLADAVTGFSYSTPVCTDAASQLPVLATGFTTGGTFTADGGLVIDAVTGEINITASTAGDYMITYTVDQSIANCVAAGTASTNLTITQVFTPVLGFDYDDSFCFGAADATPNLAADFTTGGTFTGTPGLVIDAATGVVNIEASTSGTHTVTYTFAGDPANCIMGGSSPSTFTIGDEVEFAFNGECEGSAYVLTAIAENGTFDDSDPAVSFRWTTASGTTIGTDSYIINVSDYASGTPENDTFPMELNLTVTVNGCETTRTYVIDGISCTIQKGISPNEDGFNDYFDLEFMGVKKLSIFNRYGQEVYTKGNYKNEWKGQGSNGDELPTGTYYYVIERSAGGTDTGWIYINRQE